MAEYEVRIEAKDNGWVVALEGTITDEEVYRTEHWKELVERLEEFLHVPPGLRLTRGAN